MCRSSVNTIYGRAMIGFIVVSKQNMLSLLFLSFVSQHNIWSYYEWVCRCRHSVNTIRGGIIVVVINQ